MITQILTRWSVPNAAADITSVMNFSDATPVAAQREALAGFWGAVSQALHPSVSWTIDTSGRVLDESTGGLVGTWSDLTPRTGGGNGAGNYTVANATMLLIRWRAPVIVRGRRLQGRTFVPGLASASTIGGELEAAAQAAFTEAARDFVDASVGFGIWSRPADQRSGEFHEANDGEAWRELAVQRKRRD